MKKTIKVIDLLNKIANGEEVPKKIKYDTKVMEYSTGKQDYLDYYSNGNGEWLFQYLFDKCRNTTHFINDEVEIVEEDKQIEKLVGYIYCGWFGTCKDLDREDLSNSLKKIGDKINELIDKVNKIEREVNK